MKQFLTRNSIPFVLALLVFMISLQIGEALLHYYVYENDDYTVVLHCDKLAGPQ